MGNKIAFNCTSCCLSREQRGANAGTAEMRSLRASNYYGMQHMSPIDAPDTTNADKGQDFDKATNNAFAFEAASNSIPSMIGEHLVLGGP